MSNGKLIALIVEDELPIRRLVAAELKIRGFDCDIAANGYEASRQVSEKQYDVVVTDLRMPEKHGHAFIVELLERPDRPLIVVYTGVIEPRLATDLVVRGVDDIIFKPAPPAFLAAKIVSLITRRGSKSSVDSKSGYSGQELADGSLDQGESLQDPVSMAWLSHRLSEVPHFLPNSNAALAAYDMTRAGKCSATQLAAAAKRDVSLAVEILKWANVSHCNSPSRQITNLEEAILRIGQTKVGELALFTGALSMLTPAKLPGTDSGIVWQRSMASGLAMELLIEEGGHQQIEEGLRLSALIYPLGRVVLGALFPEHYEAMVTQCKQTGGSLTELERRLFPMTHTETMAQVLAGWQLPASVTLPLKFASEDYAAIAQLSEPLRTRVELVKLAWLLGRLAVGHWQEWDFVQLPTPHALRRIGVRNVREIIRQCRADLCRLMDSGKHSKTYKPASNRAACVEAIPYVNAAGEGPDLLGELLPMLGIPLRKCAAQELRHREEVCIINGMDGMRAEIESGPTIKKAIVVSNYDQIAEWSKHSITPISLPCSIGRLSDSLLRHIQQLRPQQKSCVASSGA